MNAAQYLDALAAELHAAGWSTRPRYERIPILLHVFSPDLPQIGESIHVKAGVGGVPWFVSSTGDPLRPCHDLAGTAKDIAARLAPFSHDVHSARRRQRPRSARCRMARFLRMLAILPLVRAARPGKGGQRWHP
ncbi:hypothetical protein [Actinomadura bangladeshensis]|uniref:Uncharacterized protein n=1 Tax=Actinomadura bangladeshensis TaxID=453573 RepID=A0A4R4P323_9ACTN|nr:hypothetical protein [Actinomadura bangladeshensis]TDC15017.1 hypothetical protein E1284_16505 [Actinomadura bangladeshensis]